MGLSLRRHDALAAGNALWALAKLEHDPGAALLRAAGAQFALLLPTAAPQNIANTLQAFVAFQAQPAPELLQGTAHAIIGNIQAWRCVPAVRAAPR